MSRKNRARNKARQETAAAPSNHLPKASALTDARGWVIAMILGVTFIAFGNTIGNGFAYDDQTQVLKNDLIQNVTLSNIPTKLGLALTKEVWFFRVLQDKDPTRESGPTTPYYRPMFTLYLMMGWQLFGDWAAGWHLINILMHLLAVYFAFLIIERITGDLRLTAIATLLFAIHPLRTESVAWISGVTDLFLALFLLPSFYFYMLYREDGKVKNLAISLGLFLLAAFSKEPAVALPVFIAVYELLIINRDKPLVKRAVPAAIFGTSFFLVSVFYFVMRYQALGFVLNDNRYTRYPFDWVLMTIPIVIWKYIGLLFFPVNLTLFHATPLVKTPLDVRFILPLLGLVALVVVLWPLRKSLPARFALLWFIVNLLPVLNLSAFGWEFMVQERYVYISSIGFSLLIALGLVNLPIEKWISVRSRRTAQGALVLLIVLLLMGKTFAQNMVWKDDITLWLHGVKAAPDQTMSHYILGHKYIDRNDPEKAVQELERFMELNPRNPVVISNLAAAHVVAYQYQTAANPARADRAHLDRAIALAERGLNEDDQNPLLWDTLGMVYTYDTGYKNLDRARALFERGLRLQPENAMINFHLGATFVKENKLVSALPYLETARRQQADLPDVYKFLAYAYMASGQSQQAMEHFNQYLQKMPNAFDAGIVRQEIEKLRAQMQNAQPQS
jgi:tetratricopeptide (TPR) repeat protein